MDHLETMASKVPVDYQDQKETLAPLVAMAKLEEMVYLVYLECRVQKGRLDHMDKMVYRETMASKVPLDKKERLAHRDRMVYLEMMALKVPVASKEFLGIKAPRLYLLQSEKVAMLKQAQMLPTMNLSSMKVPE